MFIHGLNLNLNGTCRSCSDPEFPCVVMVVDSRKFHSLGGGEKRRTRCWSGKSVRVRGDYPVKGFSPILMRIDKCRVGGRVFHWYDSGYDSCYVRCSVKLALRSGCAGLIDVIAWESRRLLAQPDLRATHVQTAYSPGVSLIALPAASNLQE